MLFYLWASVVGGGPALNQYCVFLNRIQRTAEWPREIHKDDLMSENTAFVSANAIHVIIILNLIIFRLYTKHTAHTKADFTVLII